MEGDAHMQQGNSLALVGRRIYVLSVVAVVVTLGIWISNYPTEQNIQAARSPSDNYTLGLLPGGDVRMQHFRDDYWRCLISERAGGGQLTSAIECPVEGRLYWGTIVAAVLAVSGFVLSGIGKRNADG